MSKEAMKLALDRLLDEAKVLADDRPVEVGHLPDWSLDAEHMIRRLVKAFNEQPAQQEPAPANLWLYWKVDDKSVVTGPFKTHSKDEAYGLDCIDQTPLTVAAPQPAQQEPVAWCTKNNLKNMAKGFTQDVPARAMRVRQPYPKESIVLLYTSPPAQRTWVGLTDEQIEQCMKQAYATVQGRNLEHAFARAIEAAHGIKENT